jgi:tRNA U34 2-thiouridine synthase MnmA/TrmU
VARRDSSEVKEKVVKVTLDEGERGIAPGQSAVFYLGEEVLGGGIIGDYPLTKEKKNDTHKLSMI